ncbi:uncharacterized protein BYT42DRAFT_554108 [Radiomyces spectabilis]|uniref:uncharacterized protein n=1 Tax=Radiomyces spectabilis TaxID=64574 RepID=UPI00221F119F|nr:uncharacterized protein BYT42DRAFT_554108 [Radiomyces spectabilis]KAI8394292.1 hypothetical protein BYT42DRAFT_554108 [Radiomyces spectabilis]
MNISIEYPMYRQEKQDCLTLPANLPSPPNSSCGDESKEMEVDSPSDKRPSQTLSDISLAPNKESLPTHFDALSVEYCSSLPENYTIDHSSPASNYIPRRPTQSPQLDTAPSPHSSAEIPADTHSFVPSSSLVDSQSSDRPSSAIRYKFSPAKFDQIHRCQQCGKIYKHRNCLAKHLWEHSEGWELTSKLMLTKHQQVQMLEAAAILMSMDHSHRPPTDVSTSNMLIDTKDEMTDGRFIDSDDDETISIVSVASHDLSVSDELPIL